MQNVTSTEIGPGRGLGSSNEPLPRRSRRSILAWVVGIIVLVGMVGAVLLPSLCRPRETANRIKCASNLRQIGFAIVQYAQENGGHYPPSLAVLLKQSQSSPEVMVCPSSTDEMASAADASGVVTELEAAETNAAGHKHCLSYIYVGGQLTVRTALATSIVAYEPLDNHTGVGTNVLFGDGHVEFIGKSAWTGLAAAAGVAVIPSLKTQP